MQKHSDWRSAAAYLYLDDLDPAELAGNSFDAIPNISVNTAKPSGRAPAARRRLRCGGACDFATDPSQGADRVDVFWLPRLDPAVVLLAPAPQGFSSAANLSRLAATHERVASEGAYLRVEIAAGRLRIVMMSGAATSTPVAALIPLDSNFPARAASATELWRVLNRTPPLRHPDPLTRQRRQRLLLSIRALDGWLAKATYRGLAMDLFGGPRISAASSWKTDELRDRTIRLVRNGLSLMRGGYLRLLRIPPRRRR